MPLPTSVIERYHRELNSTVAKHGLDIFRMQPPRRLSQKTLRVCCGGPTEARLQGFKDLFSADETFIHTDTLMAGNSLIGYMNAQVIVLFFESRPDFNSWLADGVEADFLKLTQPVNADKLFVVRCAEPLPIETLRDILGTNNIQTSLEIAQATRTYGDLIETDPYIDAMVMIPSGKFLYGDSKVHILPDDSRGVFVIDKYLIGSGVQAEGAVFYKCYPNVQGATNIGVGDVEESVIAQPFLIAQSQVTQSLCRALTKRNPSHFEGADRPVDFVSWFGMLHLANVLSGADACYANIRSGYDGSADWIEGCRGFRLPTEREWEYACRSFSPYTYSGSDRPEEVAWFTVNANRQTHPVGQLKLNAFGTYDMSGNVWEWCWDEHNPYDVHRVLRGGAWLNGTDRIRAADRGSNPPSNEYNFDGGRLSRSLT
jgi:formylglycine-generating enzyme